jgi:hypothetical protein
VSSGLTKGENNNKGKEKRNELALDSDFLSQPVVADDFNHVSEFEISKLALTYCELSH